MMEQGASGASSGLPSVDWRARLATRREKIAGFNLWGRFSFTREASPTLCRRNEFGVFRCQPRIREASRVFHSSYTSGQPGAFMLHNRPPLRKGAGTTRTEEVSPLLAPALARKSTPGAKTHQIAKSAAYIVDIYICCGNTRMQIDVTKLQHEGALSYGLIRERNNRGAYAYLFRTRTK